MDDLISQLPDSILHHILFFLNNSDGPPAELVRMSVLSKTWFHLTAFFSVLDFSIHKFTKGSHVSRQSFFKYVNYTTSRFCHQNVIADRLNISTTIQEPAELDIVNRCLELLLKNGVRKLKIDITSSLESPSAWAKYRLPNILLSVSVLKSLTIRGCELPSSLTVDVVKFKTLIKLKLQNVHIDDEVIKYITTSCPLLQIFHIDKCPGFKSFCVYGHQYLREVRIYYNTPVERIDIVAPNLSGLFVIDENDRGAPRMNLVSCKQLTTVTYIGHPLPNSNGFTDFLSNFPFIEHLFLATTYKWKNLKFSSPSLRTLMLHSDSDLEEIEFSTPNLVFFGYSRDFRLIWPLVWRPAHLKACMQCYLDGYIDTLWFQKLRLFLDKKNRFKVLNLYIHAKYSQKKYIELERLKTIELPPYEIEHVELQLESHEESLTHIAFVDAVLWCCRPRSLTLIFSFPLTDFEDKSDLVKFTYKKLLEQEDQGHTNNQIVSPSSLEAQTLVGDLKSLSVALSCEGKAISFIKEEVVQEAAG